VKRKILRGRQVDAEVKFKQFHLENFASDLFELKKHEVKNIKKYEKI
jgi:hypothetical protein